ncbi:P-loop containing nucleoside triphosphate hydrolase protein [Limtongia smithiae]|uniref:P-loop containing nucleoside triphosphate hydrolase protein n=1 Tax=Limtongia smithiae TaxID=1125753 RepID=UPI0034CD3E02
MDSFVKSTGGSSQRRKATITTPAASVPWVEKYRPDTLADVTSQDHAVAILSRTLTSRRGAANLPHMLFYGPPGTGKTSTVLALARQLFGPELMRSRVLELNASDERGITIVREKIKNFARVTVSNVPASARAAGYPCPPYKLVILDEADSMTQDAQAALRRTMETYSRITRFCLICNYVTRIIDPLASRCSKFRFRPLASKDATARLADICTSERVAYEDGVLDAILTAADGDLRKAVTLLQSAAKLHGGAAAAGTAAVTASSDDEAVDAFPPPPPTISLASIQEISGRVPDTVIHSLLAAASSSFALDTDLPTSTDKFAHLQATVEDVILDGWSATQILLQVHDSLVFADAPSPAQKNQIVAAVSEIDKRLLDGASEHLSILDLIVRISTILT